MAEFVQPDDEVVDSINFARTLLERSYVLVELEDSSFTDEELYALQNWEAVFASAFNLDSQIKIDSGKLTFSVEFAVVGMTVSIQQRFRNI